MAAPADDHDQEPIARAPRVHAAPTDAPGGARPGDGDTTAASILGFLGGVTVPGCASAKSAVMGLTKALANEWAGLGVNVNAIAPGYVRTDNTQTLQDDVERSKAIRRRIPAGDWGTPEQIAGAAVYLSSPAADYVHGSVVTVDGGWMGR